MYPESGTGEFEPLETEFVTRKPITVEEELAACKEKLVVAREELMIANLKLKGKIMRLKQAKAELSQDHV